MKIISSQNRCSTILLLEISSYFKSAGIWSNYLFVSVNETGSLARLQQYLPRQHGAKPTSAVWPYPLILCIISSVCKIRVTYALWVLFQLKQVNRVSAITLFRTLQ